MMVWFTLIEKVWELSGELVNVDPGDRGDLIYQTTLELREIIYSRSG